MPELPEVETMVRGIRSTLEGSLLIGMEACPCRCRPLQISPRLETILKLVGGQQIIAVRRRAKRIVIELASGERFVIEPRMTGLMLLSHPPDSEHLRLRWVVEKQGRKSSIWFWDRRGLGTVRLLSAAEFEFQFSEEFLGPDALEMSILQWQTRLHCTSRPIKTALLDQKLVAGIGNLYASEILHRSRIHPETVSSTLQRRQIARLSAAVKSVLNEAIEQEGSTLSDGTYRNALNESGGYQNAHCVYARAGEKCPTCRKGTIVRIVQAQRSTFYCPRCQHWPA